MISNYHTHSHYCDGHGELRDYVEFALAHGFGALGFSGHAPVPFASTFAIKDDQYLNYCNEVRALKAEYAGRIDLKLGLEIDYIPGVLDDFSPLVETGGLEYVIGSVHLLPQPDEVDWLRDHKAEAGNHLWFIDGSRQETYDEGLNRLFHGDIREGVRAFFRQNNEMIERLRPDIVGHIDKIVMHNRGRYFQPSDRWFRDLLFETIELIHEAGLICEINTRGLYKGRHNDFYPSREAIAYMNEKHIPVIVSTDAHEPENLVRFEGAFEMLKEIGYREIVSHL